MTACIPVTLEQVQAAARALGYELVPLTPSALVAAGYEPAPVGTCRLVKGLRALYERRHDFIHDGVARGVGELLAAYPSTLPPADPPTVARVNP